MNVLTTRYSFFGFSFDLILDLEAYDYCLQTGLVEFDCSWLRLRPQSRNIFLSSVPIATLYSIIYSLCNSRWV